MVSVAVERLFVAVYLTELQRKHVWHNASFAANSCILASYF